MRIERVATACCVLILALWPVARPQAQQVAAEYEHCLVEGIDQLGGIGTTVTGGPDGWLIVWFAGTAPATLRGARIAADGTPLDPNGFDIVTTELEPLGDLTVAWGDGAWLVVWAEADDVPAPDSLYGQTDIRAVRVDPDGYAKEATVTLAAKPELFELWPRAAWLDGAWLIEWAEVEPIYFSTRDTDIVDGFDLYGVRMTSAGEILDSTPLHIATKPGREGGPSHDVFVVADDTAWLVAFEHYATDDGYVASTRGVRVFRDGEFDPEPFVISSMPDMTPEAAARTSSGWLVVSGDELVHVDPDAANFARQEVPSDMDQVALAAGDGVALMTWSVDLTPVSSAPLGSELRGLLAHPESEFSASEVFVLASDRTTHAIRHSLAAGGAGQVLVFGYLSGSAEKFALRLDTRAGQPCTPVPPAVVEPDAGVERDAGIERDAAVDSGAGGNGSDAGLVDVADASAESSSVTPVTPRDGGDEDAGSRANRRASDGGCSVPTNLRSSSVDARLLPLLLGALIAHRARRRRRAR